MNTDSPVRQAAEKTIDFFIEKKIQNPSIDIFRDKFLWWMVEYRIPISEIENLLSSLEWSFTYALDELDRKLGLCAQMVRFVYEVEAFA